MGDFKLTYEVVQSEDLGNFKKCVSIRMGKGWECQGNLVVTLTNNGILYSQAMIKTIKQ